MKLMHIYTGLLSLLLIVTTAFGQPLRLMTYNIRLELKSDGDNQWDNRKAVMAGQVQFYSPDILGIQEAMPSQVNYLDSSLTGYKHIGIAREGEGKGEASSIFYNTSRLVLLEQNTFWLSQTPDTISKGWDASYLRVCTYGLFKDKQTKKKFWVFNTHLDNTGVTAREKSVELILQKIKQVNKKNLPVLFMGDFNATPDASVILHLKKEMDDARTVSEEKPFGPSGTFNGFEFNKPVTLLIDYIFVSKTPAVSVNKYAVLSDSYNLKYPSDHLPVFVQINFTKK
jgi:endonuclease/exonuclease/phosphatase family metal-dependent hydrolase